MFITFEGIEGSGKTTQMARLGEWFEAQGKTVVLTKEPGGTELGMKIRKMILDPETKVHHNLTELMLFIADRLEHVAQCIQPALDAGHIVICDRYSDSTYAYQRGGRQVPQVHIEHMNTLVGLSPDITFLLDLDIEEGLRRAKQRAALDRFEQEEKAFHEAVRAAYLEIAEKEHNRIQVIDVNHQSPDQVFDMILDRMKTRSSV
jgi:dTMP kinase